MDGLFFVNKDIGMTSRQVGAILGKKFNTKKVGHLGTLDPFASGLLIIAMGKATKALAYFKDSVKEYIATISLGVATDSLDNTGEVLQTREVREYSIEEINEVLNEFKGKLIQTPPLTSAIHINGKRAYEYARSGKKIEVPSREIEVYDNRLISLDNKKHTLEVYFKVSKGTYIRTLGSDIANRLGTIGHLSALNRVAVDNFKIEEASSLEDILNDKVQIKSVVDTLSKVMPIYIVSDNKFSEDIKNGKIKYFDYNRDTDSLLVIDKNNNPIAIYQKNSENKLEFSRGMF